MRDGGALGQGGKEGGRRRVINSSCAEGRACRGGQHGALLPPSGGAESLTDLSLVRYVLLHLRMRGAVTCFLYPPAPARSPELRYLHFTVLLGSKLTAWYIYTWARWASNIMHRAVSVDLVMISTIYTLRL